MRTESDPEPEVPRNRPKENMATFKSTPVGLTPEEQEIIIQAERKAWRLGAWKKGAADED